jgi:hypothetical protein
VRVQGTRRPWITLVRRHESEAVRRHVIVGLGRRQRR